MVHVMVSILQVIVIADTQEITKCLCGLLHAHIQRTDSKEAEIFFCELDKIIESDVIACKQKVFHFSYKIGHYMPGQREINAFLHGLSGDCR